jgi:hypothetical protein
MHQTHSAHHTPAGVPDRSNVDPPPLGVLPRPIVGRVLFALERSFELRPTSFAELLGLRSGHRHDLCPIVERDHRGARELAHNHRQYRLD